MIRERLKERIDKCFAKGAEKGFWSAKATDKFAVENPKHASHGDFSTNLAMIVAGMDRKNPREVAGNLVELLAEHDDLILKTEIAGPGFVNFFIRPNVWQSVLTDVCVSGDDYGRSEIGKGKKVLVEFVSANPTGPLSVGHGRQAILGDSIARLLEYTGHDVTREYYYNDAGRQMRVLGESTRARYLELLDLPFEFPEDGYQGEYIYDIARGMIKEKGDSLQSEKAVEPFKEAAEQTIFADINSTLKRLGIIFDNYYNEHSLYEEGKIDAVVQSLRDLGLVYDKEDAVWFKATACGLDKDRVIIKSTGEPTYRLPDIAYHQEKFRRGFDWLVNVLGSDHIATVPDVLAGVKALGHDDSKVTVVMHQFVTLMRDGKQVKMSTRKANFVTVDELIDEVGVDVMRFFFLMRRSEAQLEFDLDLAKEQSQENPVYYVQYGHARMSSILKKAAANGIALDDISDAPLEKLSTAEELQLLKSMAAFPELICRVALDLEPHRIIFFLQELAGQFHSFYNKHQVISDDTELTKARLWLIGGLKIVLRNGLLMMGMTAPEKM